MDASLTYYIWEGLLVGTAGSRRVHTFAASGGGGGGKKPSNAANNPYSVGVRTSGQKDSPDHVHGGPIPPGKYLIAMPQLSRSLGWCAQLLPYGKQTYGRGGFYLHLAGPHGTDGCIAVKQASEFYPLMLSLTFSFGGVLFVEEATGGVHFG